MNFLRRVARLLGHFRDQEGTHSDTDQGPQDVQYDDRQSMSPFIHCEQYTGGPAHHDPGEKKDGESRDQRGLIKWTKVLDVVTGLLALATFVVAGFSGWQVYEMRNSAQDFRKSIAETHRIAEAAHDQVIQAEKLANAARDQANIADDTEKRQLRAYISVEGAAIAKFGDTINKPEAHVILKNSGRTPDYKVAGWSAIKEAEFPFRGL
jgi:hypothetical protein